MHMSTDSYKPRPEHKFSFGLWTVGNRGRDPFGDAVRPPVKPVDLVHLLGEIGAWGVNLHDNDLVPIDATISSTLWVSRAVLRAHRIRGCVELLVDLAHEAPMRERMRGN